MPEGKTEVIALPLMGSIRLVKARRVHLTGVSRGSGTFTGGGPELAKKVCPEWGLE